MFFPDRIRNIKKRDRVLEIGPGGTPHPRADIFLEYRFSEKEAMEQRGHTPDLKTGKRVVYYRGETFPFSENEFDYVICSHVVEHVKDVRQFCSELFRVGSSGYIEFPTIYYEYLYNFSVHVQLLNFQSGELRHMAKKTSGLDAFHPVQMHYYRTLQLGYTDMVDSLKPLMFQGFEWTQTFPVREVAGIDELIHPESLPVDKKPRSMRIICRALNWLNDRARLP